MRRLLLATRNEGKLRELHALLDGLELRLETLAGHPEVTDVEEDGATFEENARKKASHAARRSGLWAVAEDSGLCVDALGGAPGVRSARYSGVHGDDAANNARLLRELGPNPDRGAHYVCALALPRPDGEIVASARGVCEGSIAAAPRGTGGFGYDPLFLSERLPGLTMAEMPSEQKNLISHRGQALHAFLPLLRAHLSDTDEPKPDHPDPTELDDPDPAR
jgi:XTP/dITP diphosphohydrolase